MNASERVKELLVLTQQGSKKQSKLPLWARAYRDVVGWTKAGKPTANGQLELLREVLDAHLTEFFSTPEGQAITDSQAQAMGRLFTQANTGKDSGLPTADELHIAWAQLDLKCALRSKQWQDYAAKAGPKFFARLGRAMERKSPEANNADVFTVFYWTRPVSTFYPPLCFATDQAAADIIATLGNPDVNEETFRQWRRRWKLQPAPFKLIRRVTTRAGSLTLA